jgi:ribonuclease P/MRP protein subunit POP5
MEESRPKFLPPVLREPKRYIVFEIIFRSDIEYKDMVSALNSSMLGFLGELQTANANTWIIKNLYNRKKGVVRCVRNSVEQIRTCLALIHTIAEQPAIVKVLGVSGTLKSARNKYLSDN